MDAAVTCDDGRVNEVRSKKEVLNKGDGVRCDVGGVVVFDAGLSEIVMVGVAGVGDGDAGFLNAEDVNGVIDSVVNDGGVVICFSNVVGAEAQGVRRGEGVSTGCGCGSSGSCVRRHTDDM